MLQTKVRELLFKKFSIIFYLKSSSIQLMILGQTYTVRFIGRLQLCFRRLYMNALHLKNDSRSVFRQQIIERNPWTHYKVLKKIVKTIKASLKPRK